MPRALRYTDKALADLCDIKDWLTQPGSGMAARKRLLSIQTTINRLRGHPYLFPVGEMPGVRELVRDGVRKLLRIRNSMLTFDEAG